MLKDLKFRSDLEYYVFGGGVTAPWSYNLTQVYANTEANMQSAMEKIRL